MFPLKIITADSLFLREILLFGGSNGLYLIIRGDRIRLNDVFARPHRTCVFLTEASGMACAIYLHWPRTSVDHRLAY